MTRTTGTLMPIDEAMRVLTEARSPHEIIDIANRAEALRRYAQRARLGLEAQNRCAEVRLRAERTLGQFLASTQRHGGGRPRVGTGEPPSKPVNSDDGFPRLSDLGISRQLSHRAQRLADIPDAEFERYLAAAR